MPIAAHALNPKFLNTLSLFLFFNQVNKYFRFCSWRNTVVTFVHCFNDKMRFKNGLVFARATAKRRKRLVKLFVKQHTDYFTIFVEQRSCFFCVFFSAKRRNSTKECLLNNQIIIAFVLKKIFAQNLYLRFIGKLFFQCFNGFRCNVNQCDVCKTVFNQVFCFVSIATTRNENSRIFVWVLFYILRNGRRSLSDVPTCFILLPTLVPIVLVKWFFALRNTTLYVFLHNS